MVKDTKPIISVHKDQLVDLKFRLLTKSEYSEYRHDMPLDSDYWWWLQDKSNNTYTKSFVDEEGYIDNLISDNTKLGLRLVLEFNASSYNISSSTKRFIYEQNNYVILYTSNNITVAISEKVLYDQLTYDLALTIIKYMNINNTSKLTEDLLNIYKIVIAQEKPIDDNIILPTGAISNIYEIMQEHDKKMIL